MYCSAPKPILLLLFVISGSLHAQQVEQMMHARPFMLSGNVDATTIFYKANGIPDRYLPFNYVVSGSPVISLYGMQIPFSFVIGKQQNKLTQPFNQFGLSPSYKWVTLHLGYRNLVYSDFTLNGHTFLGAGVELNPGKFRFSAMYGQFNKASPLDTAQTLYFSNFTYKRTGMAVKIGYGTSGNFFDLIALRAKDDAGSLNPAFKGLADTMGIAPAENTVTGYNMRLSFWRQHLIFESEGALSLYTNDVNAQPILDSSFEKNVRTVNNLAKVNVSSELYGAIKAAIRFKTRNFSVRLQYSHIDPGYQSMGTYFLNNDLENYTIAPTFTAFKNKLRFSGSLGIQHDDLANAKRAKARKVIGSANLTAELTQRLGLDCSFSNYSINQTVKTIRFADSLKVVESSSQLSVMPHYLIPGAILSHNIFLVADVSQAKELNPARTDSLNSHITTTNFILNYQVSFVPQKASIFLSLNHTQMKSPSLTDGNQGVTLGLSGSWLKDKLMVSASAGYLWSKRNEEKGTIITSALQGRYNFYGRHVLHIRAFYTRNEPGTASALYPTYSEIRAEAGYGFSFR